MNKNSRCRLSLCIFVLTVFACCGLAGAAEAGAGAGLQTSDTFGVGERIPSIPTGISVFSCKLRGSGSGSVAYRNGVVTITLAGKRLECSDYTYTCDTSLCEIVDQVVTQGIVRREPAGGGTNQPPRATGSIPAQTLTVGGRAVSVNVARYFTDPDGDRLTYTASSSRSGIVRAQASSSTVTLTPVAAGTATVTVTARDPDGASATQSIAVTVEEDGGTNRPPRATGSIPAQTLTVGGRSASVSVARYFTDPDGDALTYSARSSRTGVVRASASGSTVTLSPGSAGTATVTVTARDPDGLSATQSISVTVEDEGGGPALWSSTLTAQSFELTINNDPRDVVGYIRIEAGQRGELSDPDFELRGTAHQVRALLQISDNGVILFGIDPPPDDQDVRAMTLTADGHALAVSDASVEDNNALGALIVWPDPGFRWSDGQRVAVQLTTGQDGGGANRAPRATGSIPAQTLSVGGRAASVNVARYFTDPDGDALTYSARSSRTGVVRAGASGSTVTLTPVAAGTATITVTARDPGGLSATQSMAVTVQAGGGTNRFTDDPLVSGTTPVRAVHFRELRTRIDALRTGAGLSAYAWTDRALTPGVTRVRTVHLTELRTALNQAYASAGRPRPAWTDAGVRAGTTPIRAVHITELRAAVVELENAAPTGLMPDLVVGSPAVSDSTLTPGQSFTLSATVRNRGSARAAATTLRWYRSTDSRISTSDTAVGTDAVSALAAGASGGESIGLTAPGSAGTYYYGACVEPVGGESDTGNNCSSGVRVTVESDGGGDAIEGEITRCAGTALLANRIQIDMEGTVRALRALTNVVVRGWVGDYAMAFPDFLGSMAAGETKNFSLTDFVDSNQISAGARCRVEVTGRTSSGNATAETTSVSEMRPIR